MNCSQKVICSKALKLGSVITMSQTQACSSSWNSVANVLHQCRIDLRHHRPVCPLLNGSAFLPEYFTPHLGEYVNVLSALEKLNVAILKAMDKTKEVGDVGFYLYMFTATHIMVEISTQHRCRLCFCSWPMTSREEIS